MVTTSASRSMSSPTSSSGAPRTRSCGWRVDLLKRSLAFLDGRPDALSSGPVGQAEVLVEHLLVASPVHDGDNRNGSGTEIGEDLALEGKRQR